MKTLIIDNYDSFTYNLVQMVAEINKVNPIVIKNDANGWEKIKKMKFDNIIITSGSGKPENQSNFGVCKDALLDGSYPVLAISLGHQGLAHYYGGKVINAPFIKHGEVSKVFHDGAEIFKDIPKKFNVSRFHSLIVDQELPNCLQKICWTEEGEIMGVAHRTLPLWGVQFQPDSICSEYGIEILRNFNDLSMEHLNKKGANRSLKVIQKELDSFYSSQQIFEYFYKKQEYSYWLDSNQDSNEFSRYSYIGINNGPLFKVIEYNQEQEIILEKSKNESRIINQTIFDYLREQTETFKTEIKGPFGFSGGFVGYFGYELKNDVFDFVSRHKSSTPDAMFMFSDRFIVFDNKEQKCHLVCLTDEASYKENLNWLVKTELMITTMLPYEKNNYDMVYHGDMNDFKFRLSLNKRDYKDSISRIKKCILDGDLYEVNLTNRLHCNNKLESYSIYKNLRHVNPAPYSSFIDFKDFQILSSSPERFMKINKERDIEVKPIKGTIKRSKDTLQDEKLMSILKNSKKDFSENLITVDLMRNDLNMVCEAGSVEVTKLMEIESFHTVHQLVSTITGKLKKELSIIDAIKMTFPGGSMTGVPKRRALEIIDKLETEARGIYSGSLGYISMDGEVDLSIVIRTIVATKDGLTIGAGGAITYQSDSEAEFEEMLLKTKALLKAIEVTYEESANSVDLF